MDDVELTHRANLYAQVVIGNSKCPAAADMATEIARAFVIGFAAGLEEAAKSAHGMRRTVRK